MKKIALLSLALLASMTLAGCGAKTPAITPLVQDTPASEATPSKESFSGTLEQLMARGKSAKCTAVTEAEGVKTAGEFYIDGATGRSRVLSKVAQADKPEQITNMILTKETIYFWQDGQKQGFQYPAVKPDATTETTAPGAEKQNENYEFNCEAWNIDESLFTVPTDVNFVDQAAMMKDLQKKSGVNIPNK